MLFVLASCAPAQPSGGAASPATPAQSDTTGMDLVPAGYGTIRQDEIAIRLQPPGLVVRLVPLDEGFIRLLTPDSYRALRDLQQSASRRVAELSQRFGGRQLSLWLVSFYGVEPDIRFTPMDLIITSTGRDFRPVDVLALSSGFGEQRLKQRETQSAIFVFDGEIDLDQPLVVRFLNEQNAFWEQVLPRIERERALVRARSLRAPSP
ncbi:MAG TPA: hypothetical protein VMY38_02360 [Gemmatimonadaceae bacterium]|nr:hypothetical protein [Gemmatimonadaceae bacterium]